jgi:hypothetical protein
MILFVFEGSVAEPAIFKSLEYLYLGDEDVQIVRYGNDLPTLYKKLRDNDYDLFRVLPFKENGIEIPVGERLDTLFSQVFLFFDYDFQNRMGTERLDIILKDMLDYFNDETGCGKLYVNYPMVESLKYTKEMPDINYFNYVVSREDCLLHKFKSNAELFAYPKARGYRFINIDKTPTEEIKHNWEMLKLQNVSKANYICNDKYLMPENKEDIAQDKLFAAMKQKYVDINQTVAILNSFPIFVFDYLK